VNNSNPIKPIAPPQGYATQSTDVVGFWNAELSPSIHFKPVGFKLFDSKLDPMKPSVLIVGTLVDAATLEGAGDDKGEVVQGKPGDSVGVWGKAGMAAVKNLCGVPVWMTPNGEKDIGRASPMKLYDVRAPGRGTRLPCLDDSRKRSAGVPSFLDERGPVKAGAAPGPTGIDDDQGL